MYEAAVNLKTAKALEIELPTSILLRADGRSSRRADVGARHNSEEPVRLADLECRG